MEPKKYMLLKKEHQIGHLNSTNLRYAIIKCFPKLSAYCIVIICKCQNASGTSIFNQEPAHTHRPDVRMTKRADLLLRPQQSVLKDLPLFVIHRHSLHRQDVSQHQLRGGGAQRLVHFLQVREVLPEQLEGLGYRGHGTGGHSHLRP